MSKKTLFFSLILILIGKISTAQEMYGHVNSNYSGITGATLNPTSIVNSRLYFDFNLIGAHLNVENNAIYLARNEYKFSRFLSASSEFPEHGEDDRVYYDYFNEDLKNAFVQMKILGPSFMYSKNDKAFGLSTSIRNIVSARDIPYEIAKFGAEGFDYYPLHRIRFIDNQPFRAGGLSFGEVAATYAQVVRKQNMDHLTAGITIKGLFGFGGGYWNVDNADYMLPNGDTLIAFNVNGSAGISLPIDYADNDILLPEELINGTGIGADIGVTYQLKMKGHNNKKYSACEQPFEEYYFKVGVSLIDVGYVKFKKRTKQIELTDADGTWVDFTHQNIDNFDDLFGSVSGTFGPDSTSLVNSESFSMFLPSALSAQFDYRYNKQIYINASIVYPLIPHEHTIVRPTTISLTPRYESNRFELAVPITLYEFLYPRVGLSMRLANVTIGTDKLGGFFGLHDFTGLDLYFMVKFSLVKGNCFGKGKGFNCGNDEYRKYERNMGRLKVRPN